MGEVSLRRFLVLLVGIILIIAGVRGKLGAVLGVFLAPETMLSLVGNQNLTSASSGLTTAASQVAASGGGGQVPLMTGAGTGGRVQ